MVVGVVREVKAEEWRVALTPSGARDLAAGGHRVLVERGAGIVSGFPDEAYAQAGTVLVDAAADVWAESELLLKVKEPVPAEFGHFHAGLTLFAYLHLAPDRELTEAIVRSGMTAIAYETVEDGEGRLPLLAPMSAIAGRLAAQAAASFLLFPAGGPGVLIGGAPGVPPANVLVLGGGIVGTHAARVACGMQAAVTILERSQDRLRHLEETFGSTARVLMSDADTLDAELRRADVLIGAVLVPGAIAPRLVTREMLAEMQPGRVVIDVAIDQGGCVETARPTTHGDPTYVVDGILHYCVANIPGAVPVTSTRALTNATFPYVRKLADLSVDVAVASDPGLASGVNIARGAIVSTPVAAAHSGERSLVAA